MLIHLLVLVIPFIVFDAGAQQSCLTPHDNFGICINVKECQSMMEMFRNEKPLSNATIQFLRESQCNLYAPEGTPVKVCCGDQQSKITGTLDVPPNPPDVTNHKNLRLLEHNICGPAPISLIVSGGNETRLFSYPWMALIKYRHRYSGSFDFRCGGTIINKRYILTAAHCVTGLLGDLTLFGVRVGEHDISTEIDCQKKGRHKVCADKYQDFLIESSYHHPEFSHVTKQNDIGLLRLERDINFEPKNVKPICLPINPLHTLHKAKVTGWGATESAPRSNVLLEAELPLVPNERCAQLYKSSSHRISYNHMCAGDENGTDTCAGDSGGPLQSLGNYGVESSLKVQQIGIVSFGSDKCGKRGGLLTVFTRVSYFMDWILDTIKE